MWAGKSGTVEILKKERRKMKSILKCIAAAAVMYAASATAAVLPRVGTGTEPNQWTSNVEGVLSESKTTNLPILLVMINDSSTGEGCQHCMQFVNNTLNTDNFSAIVSTYKFYMVLLNQWSAPSEPAYGGVPQAYFDKYFYMYQMGDYGYPQVILITPNGDRYTGWSYETRPVSSSGPGLYKYLSAALAEIAPTTSGYVPPPAAETPAATETPTETPSQPTTPVSSGEVPNGKYALFFFNGYDEIVGSAQMRVYGRGKWSAKILKNGGSTTLRGSVVKSNGSLSTGSSTLNLTYDSSTGIWSGTYSGDRVYGKIADKADATWKGAWNVGFYSSASPAQGGWATATVGTTGKVTFSGKISNSTKISGNCESAVFPAAFVSAYIPRWAGRGNVRFAHGSTRAKVNVGCALFSDGTLAGNVSYDTQVFDAVGGSFWKKSLIAGLNGKTFSTVGAGYVSVPVTATASKIAAGTNGYNARIRCTASRGQVAATYKANGKTYKSTGVIYNSDYAPIALGGGKQGDEKFTFTIK